MNNGEKHVRHPESTIISHLECAVSACDAGLSLFKDGNYSKFPDGKEREIMAYCKMCSAYMKSAQDLDTTYYTVYREFSEGGDETNCRIGKNRWCFAKQEFAKARITDLRNQLRVSGYKI